MSRASFRDDRGWGRMCCSGRPYRPDPAREIAAIGLGPHLRGRDVLEIGAGEGRLTVGLAALARRVLAVDADGEAIAAARVAIRAAGFRNVSFAVAPAQAFAPARRRFDVAVFSWSL